MQQSALPLKNPLWDYALDIYMAEGMKTVFLALQDQGYEINLLLTLLWLAEEKCTVDDRLLNTLHAVNLQETIRTFRHLRETVKHHRSLNDTYQDFLTLELKLEQRELALYYLQAEKKVLNRKSIAATRKEATDNNLSVYCLRLARQPNDFNQLKQRLYNNKENTRQHNE